MRREGYEFSVSKPKVMIKEIDGVKYEPLERVYVEVPEEYQVASLKNYQTPW